MPLLRKVRLQLEIDPKTADRFEIFMSQRHHKSMSAAALELLKTGLAVFDLPDKDQPC